MRNSLTQETSKVKRQITEGAGYINTSALTFIFPEPLGKKQHLPPLLFIYTIIRPIVNTTQAETLCCQIGQFSIHLGYF